MTLSSNDQGPKFCSKRSTRSIYHFILHKFERIFHTKIDIRSWVFDQNILNVRDCGSGVQRKQTNIFKIDSIRHDFIQKRGFLGSYFIFLTSLSFLLSQQWTDRSWEGDRINVRGRVTLIIQKLSDSWWFYRWLQKLYILAVIFQ